LLVPVTGRGSASRWSPVWNLTGPADQQLALGWAASRWSPVWNLTGPADLQLGWAACLRERTRRTVLRNIVTQGIRPFT
jgi:hypothetical protein